MRRPGPCWIVILPAALALWGIATQKWHLVAAALGLYLALVLLSGRSVLEPCRRSSRLRSVPMPSDHDGTVAAASGAPVVGGRVFVGGANVCP